jgi:hypothetical protein
METAMTRILIIATFGFAAIAATGASAGCNPACKSGETCRYEAAGGKYYCEAKGIKAGGATLRPGSTSALGPVQTLRTLGK